MTDINIGVIIPTYNRSGMLERALESVFNQSWRADEIVVVDDGSEDDTQVRLERYRQLAGGRLKVVLQQNRGPAAARNAGIRTTEAALLAFLDSDDQWHRRKLEIQASSLSARPEYRISHTLETWYRNGCHLNQKKRHRPPHGWIFERCLELCCVGMSTAMVHREIFDQYGLFDEQMRCCEDYDLWLRLAVTEPFLLIEEQLTVKHGGRADQVSATHRVGMDKHRIGAIDRILQSNRLNRSQQELAAAELYRKCSIYGRGCLRHGRTEEGRRILRLGEDVRSKYL